MIIYSKIILMCLTLYFIRILPFIFFKKEIKNKYIKAFLNYVPYVTIAVMTFPAILNSTDNKLSGIAAFITGLVSAWFGGNIFTVAIISCVTVLITDHIIFIF